MENKVELKPCPFCGTPPSLEYEMVYPLDRYSRVFGVKWEVICPYCGTTKTSGITDYILSRYGELLLWKDDIDGRAKAIELWNERAGE